MSAHYSRSTITRKLANNYGLLVSLADANRVSSMVREIHLHTPREDVVIKSIGVRHIDAINKLIGALNEVTKERISELSAMQDGNKDEPIVGKDGEPITLATVLEKVQENAATSSGPEKDEPRSIQNERTAGRPVWSVEEWKTNGVVVGYLFKKIAGEPIQQTYIAEESLGAALRLFRKQNDGSALLDLSAVE